MFFSTLLGRRDPYALAVAEKHQEGLGQRIPVARLGYGNWEGGPAAGRQWAGTNDLDGCGERGVSGHLRKRYVRRLGGWEVG
jgi:hypothetical protein